MDPFFRWKLYCYFFHRKCVDKKEQELNKVSKLITKPERKQKIEMKKRNEKNKRKLFEADSGWHSRRPSHHCSFCCCCCVCASFFSPIHSFGVCADESFKWSTPQKQNWIWIFNFHSKSSASSHCGRKKMLSSCECIFLVSFEFFLHLFSTFFWSLFSTWVYSRWTLTWVY